MELAPSESTVSPVCIEGRGQYLSMMRCRAGLSPEQMQPVPVEPGAGHRWFANVPLSPNGATRVQIFYQNGSLEENQAISWRETNLLEANDITLRRGDALLLTAKPAEAKDGKVTISVIGATNYVTDTATPIPHRFDRSGTFVVAGEYEGSTKAARAVTVKVVDASFDGPVAAWAGYWRYWDCTNLPPEVVLDVDPRLRIEPVPESVRLAHIPVPPPLGPNGHQFRITMDAAEPRVVLARLGANGPVLASVTVDGFRMFGSQDTYLRWLKGFEDGSDLLEAAYILSPREVLTGGLSVNVSVAVSGVTFEDGTLSKTLTERDFDELGICRVRLIRAPGVITSVCHRTKVIQNGVVIRRPPDQQ
jgi:hypothetical protein